MWPVYLAALLYLCLRAPHEFIHGAVVGEEGTVYLRFAWNTPWLYAVMAQHQGYYSLWANICGILAARVLPLTQAAHFFVLAQIASEMLMVYVIVQCERFASFRQKILGVAVALLTPPTVAVMMSTVNAQFFIAVATSVILVSDANRLKIFRVITIAFAGLNGVVSCVLLPLFLYRAWKERTSARLAQAAALFAATVYQFVKIFGRAGIPVGQRSGLPYYFGTFLVNAPLGQFLTHWSVQDACRLAGSPTISRYAILWPGSLVFGSVFYLVLLAAILRKISISATWLAAGGLLNLLLGLSRGGGVNYTLMCGSSGHYFFVFNVLTGLVLVIAACEAPRRLRLVARCLIILLLFSGAVDLYKFDNAPNPPDWAGQVALWRSNPSYGMITFYDYWGRLKLTPQHGSQKLPDSIYDSTNPNWRDR